MTKKMVQLTFKQIEKEEILIEIKRLHERICVIDGGKEMRNAKYVLGDNIKKYRLEKKVTQKVLGQRVGISPSTISMIESGLKEMKTNEIDSFAKALNIPLVYLFEDWEGED